MDNNQDNNQTTVIKGDNNKVNLTSIVEDNNGGLSSVRIVMLSWSLGVLLIWSTGCVMSMYHSAPFPEIPTSTLTVLLGVTGIKTIQRFGEK